MYLDAISEYNDDRDVLEIREKISRWNSHEIEKLPKTEYPDIVNAIYKPISASFDRIRDIEPMMSGGGKVSADVDNDGNWTVGGEISFEWGGSKSDNDGNKSSNENTSSDSPSDSSDLDPDKN